MSGLWTVTEPAAAGPELGRVAVLADDVDLVSQPGQGRGEAGVVDVRPGPAEQVAVEDQNLHIPQAISPTATERIRFRPMQNPRQIYRLRARASGREVYAPVEPDGVYLDRETGEEMEPVTRTLPLAPSDSALLRTPENLRPAAAATSSSAWT